MQKLRSVAALSLLLIAPSALATPQEDLVQCEKDFVTCSELVDAQDKVIVKQDAVIERLNKDITTLEIKAESRNKWYKHPAFWAVMGVVTGLATGIGIGVGR